MKYLLTILICIPFLIEGQSDETPTAAQMIYKEIMVQLGNRNFVAIDSLSRVMYNVAKVEGDTKGMGNALSTKAMMATYKGDFDTADSLMMLSSKHYEDAKMYDDLASCYSEISGVKRKKGDIELAFVYARKGQALLSKCKKKQARIFNSNILSLLHKVTGQMDSSIYYQLDVVKRLPAIDSFGLTQGYNNLSSSFLSIGNHQKRKKYLNLALDYSSKNSSSRGGVLYELSDFELGEGHIDYAMEYAQTSLTSYKKALSKTRLKDGYLAVAKVYLVKEDYNQAGLYLDTIASLIGEQNLKYSIDYLLAELQLSIAADRPLANGITLDKISKAVYEKDHLNHKVRFHGLMHKYYKNAEDYKHAEENLQKQINYSKALTGQQNIQTVNNLEELYKSEQKELKINNLNLENKAKQADIKIKNRQLIIGGIGLGLISLLSFFLLRIYRQVKSQKEIITKALSEKEILLREIHHRVKNNLQLVSSLLTMQGRSIDDATALQAINEGKSRVRSMALIHQDLYNKENLTSISVKTYIEKLTQELFNTYRVDKDRITLLMDIEDQELDVDTLVPIGLIINELITNSLKYAFPKNQTGNLIVSLKSRDSQIVLSVKDNGIGYKPDQVRSNSFGSTLISALTNQIEGKMDINSSEGTETTITFNPIL